MHMLITGTEAFKEIAWFFYCLFVFVLQFSVRGYALLYARTSIICLMLHGLPQKDYLAKQLLAKLTSVLVLP